MGEGDRRIEQQYNVYDVTHYGPDEKVRGKWGVNNLPTKKTPLFIDSQSLTCDLIYYHPSPMDPEWSLQATYVASPPLVMSRPFKTRLLNWITHVGQFVATGGLCVTSDSNFFGLWTFIALFLSFFD